MFSFETFKKICAPLAFVITIIFFTVLFKLHQVPILEEEVVLSPSRNIINHFSDSNDLIIKTPLGKFVHTPFYLLFQSIISTAGGTLASLRLSYIVLNCVSLVCLYISIRSVYQLNEVKVLLYVLSLITLPIVSFSFFTLETFFFAFVFGLATCISYKNFSFRTLGLILGFGTFVNEVGFVYPVALGLYNYYKEKNAQNFIYILFPSVFVILCWFWMEFSFVQSGYGWQTRAKANYEYSFESILIVSFSYLKTFAKYYWSGVLVFILPLFFKGKSKLNLINPTLVLSLLFVILFFVFFNHYHPKDMIGSTLLLFFILIGLSRNTNYFILSTVFFIGWNIYSWKIPNQNYYSPYTIYESHKVKKVLTSVFKNDYGIDIDRIWLDQRLRLSLRESKLNYRPLKLSKDYILVDDRSKSKVLKRAKGNYCPLHVFKLYGNNGIIEEKKIDNCLDDFFSSEGILDQNRNVFYKKI